MGQISNHRIIILIISLIIVFLIISLKPESKTFNKETKLSKSMTDFVNWKKLGHSSFEKAIVDALLLDDYINMKYSNEKEIISLYIGYYYSTKKVGAAHDPMVCFPGQGWKISDNNTGKLTLKSGDIINYSIMLGQLGQEKELIIYWFQSYDITNSNTFSQKLSLLWKKLFHQGEDNAFVRITISLNDKSISEKEQIIFNFIEGFYPSFKKYIVEK